jgi:hypothetical protein
MPVNHFPDHLVNVLDYCSCNPILPWDIYRPCEQFPRPPCECPGLLLIKGQNNVRSTLGQPYLIRFKEDKNIRSPVQSASSSHKLFK